MSKGIIKDSARVGTTYQLKDGRNSEVLLELALNNETTSLVCVSGTECILVMIGMDTVEYVIPFELAVTLYDLPTYNRDSDIMDWDYPRE